MWAKACRPIFEVPFIPGDGGFKGMRPAPASHIKCPEDLVLELAKNNLLVDQATDARGNCGIDGFLRSWRAADSTVNLDKHKSSKDQWQELRNTSKSKVVAVPPA